jgi:deoxyribodipyrimidine photolyase
MFEWFKRTWQTIKETFTRTKSDTPIENITPTSIDNNVGRGPSPLSQQQVTKIKQTIEQSQDTVKKGRVVASNLLKRGQNITQAAQPFQKLLAKIDRQIIVIDQQILAEQNKVRASKTQDKKILTPFAKKIIMLKEQKATLEKQKRPIQERKAQVEEIGKNYGKSGAHIGKLAEELAKKTTANAQRLEIITSGPSATPGVNSASKTIRR